MKEDIKKGFTLIELLVVVLIIGILSAVALPQYQKAIDKTRVTNYIARVQDIIRAEQVYYLTNGEYTPDLSKLDVNATKICTSHGGACDFNELYNCPGKFGFNLPAKYVDGKCSFSSGDNPLVYLKYCPESSSNCGTGDGNYKALIIYSVKTGKRVACLGTICNIL